MRPNPSIERTATGKPASAAHVKRVRRAWRVTTSVRVRQPGRSKAEGWGNGKGVIVRWGLEEAEPEAEGRWTRTGYEAWHIWGDRARDREALHLRQYRCAL